MSCLSPSVCTVLATNIIVMEYYPPLRFGIVNVGLYRGAYPTLSNFRYLQRLKLKHLIALTPEPPNQDVKDFCINQDHSIEIHHFQILQNAQLTSSGMQQTLLAAFQRLLQLISTKSVDVSSVYICCTDGRKMTCLLVAMYRKYIHWNSFAVMMEYWQYFNRDRGQLLIPDVEKQTKDIEKFLNDTATQQ